MRPREEGKRWTRPRFWSGPEEEGLSVFNNAGQAWTGRESEPWGSFWDRAVLSEEDAEELIRRLCAGEDVPHDAYHVGSRGGPPLDH